MSADTALRRSRFIGELLLRRPLEIEASNLKGAAAPRVYSPFADESAPTCLYEIGPKPGAHGADKEPDRAWERRFFRTLIKKVVDRQKKFSSFFPACRKPL
jgi:hypothetical protein